MHYLLGVDLGTSGCKTVLFDIQGKIKAAATVSYPLMQPKNGWAEQQPEDWYQAAVRSMRQVVAESGINPKEVLGASIAGQMHGLVMLNSSGEVMRPAILWCDSRTQKQCDEITSKVGARRLLELNGNPALTGFTASKLLWVREYEPELFSHCETILLPKDYVRYRLTGQLYAEISDASGTNLFDQMHRSWSAEIMDALELKLSLLPEVLESSAVAGTLTAEAAEVTGLYEGMLIAGGAADNAAAALGTGVCHDGEAFVTLGTSGVIFAHTSKPVYDPQGRVHTFCAAVPGEYAILSCTLACGQSLRFGRDLMFKAEKQNCERDGEDIYEHMTAEAATVPVGADGLIYLPYLMGERSPLLDAKARGVFFGLSALHTRAHVTRAILEGICFSQKHNLEVLEQMKVVPDVLRVCGGGAKSRLIREMLADMFKKPVCNVKSAEGPALGAAILAGCAAGVYASVNEGCRQCVELKEGQCEPKESNSELYDQVFSLYKHLYSALKPAFSELENLRLALGQ